MKTIEIYKFEELNKDTQNTIIEREREKTEIYLDFFYDDCIEIIKKNGFYGNVKLEYSLSYSQGDGLSFSFDYYDNLMQLFTDILGTEKKKTIECIVNNISLNCKGNNGRYCYAHRNDINLELDNYYVKSSENIDDLISEVESNLRDIYIDLCEQLEQQGYSEIEYQYSDECIIDYLNSHEFTIDGIIV